MNRLPNPLRVCRLIDDAIAAVRLRLDGLRVLTEAASGAYVVTAVLAARAGALVDAVAADSSYGSAAEVIAYGREWARRLGVDQRITFTDRPARELAAHADIATNLRFVRPIDADFVRRLPPHAVVPLMWEPWEVRPADIDLVACAAAGVAVIGTRETDPRLRIFDYVGMTAVKLAFAAGVEVFRNRIIVLGTDPFGAEVTSRLAALGADVVRVVPAPGTDVDALAGPAVENADLLVVVEHRDRRVLVGGAHGIRIDRFRHGGCGIVHIAGVVDAAAIAAAGVRKIPAHAVPAGHMAALTDVVGPRPVIDLHAAGLRVGEIAVRTRRAGGSVEEAIAAAEASGLGARLPAAVAAP